MFYNKLKDKDLLESYTTAMDYSGKADKNLIAEIKNRGGIEKLKGIVNAQNIIPNEIKRLNKLIIDFYNQGKTPIEAKSEIESEILSQDEKNKLIDNGYQNLEKNKKDISINTRTIIGSVVGFLIAVIIGAAISYYTAATSGKIVYAIPAIIFVISYIIIRVLTGQSKNNWVVFVTSFFQLLSHLLLDFG